MESKCSSSSWHQLRGSALQVSSTNLFLNRTWVECHALVARALPSINLSRLLTPENFSTLESLRVLAQCRETEKGKSRQKQKFQRLLNRMRATPISVPPLVVHHFCMVYPRSTSQTFPLDQSPLLYNPILPTFKTSCPHLVPTCW